MSNEHSALEIRRAVVARYAARARAALGDGDTTAPAVEACCAPIAPAPATVLQFVSLSSNLSNSGEAVACGIDGCCEGDGAEAVSNAVASGLYAASDVSALPDGAIEASAGCGNPVAIAEMQVGETVLDLGCGGGLDCFLAAQQVGETGAVWGLDMTPEMVQLARRNAEQVRLSNVRFRLGEIEDMPFADGMFAVIISNCVINLSPDKGQVFREAFRVLRPGGRLRVSDMVLTKPLPPEVAGSLSDWAGCVAGALPVEEYLGLARAAGFTDARASYEDTERGIVSALVFASKPR